ncbi:hypothetical protein ILT44_20295 [Microvirga sp. BT689]|uniref:hypothetical protein n=1 Tax=Microvirga arvi TaxID=2778731 RepID=UPI001950A2BF|nr:hypothetical protein [Microvirga arvi]MBM6582549.1 hypothetical protein [Microvirga arvi]
MLIERISQQQHKLSDQPDQEIAIAAGAQGGFFSGVLIPCDESLHNRSSRADSIVEFGGRIRSINKPILIIHHEESSWDSNLTL